MRTNSGRDLQPGAADADYQGMNNIACSAVAQAALVAATASLDNEGEWPLLQVAGWLTTAADLMLEAVQVEAALALI
ncbi:hypothetical protein [Blastococcus haudaquaticus]|uniref:Uncharacterized protein n=1 Tax=Blastococcus haudaquaticus TaxID=1938745 RepID=A0A286GDJ5_9ACTN|nr:hypothetical protein [Blastococcus haudaquaticus]SOD93577.1 hypothetical protein SAMN06272739_0347 [Blastococcus haudaquaticus]